MRHNVIHSAPVSKLGKERSEKWEHRGRNNMKSNHYFLRKREVTGREEKSSLLLLPLLSTGAHTKLGG